MLECTNMKHKDRPTRKKLKFPDQDKDSNSDSSEDTFAKTRLFVMSENREKIVRKEQEDEKSSKVRHAFPGKTSSNDEKNSSLQNFLETKHSGSYKCNKTNVDHDNDDEAFAISKITDAVKKLSNENILRPRITFLDFAGESLYYAFHQIYLSPKTCYIFVVDMTKSPKEKVHEPDEDERYCSRFKSWKYQGNEHALNRKTCTGMVKQSSLKFIIKITDISNIPF